MQFPKRPKYAAKVSGKVGGIRRDLGVFTSAQLADSWTYLNESYEDVKVVPLRASRR